MPPTIILPSLNDNVEDELWLSFRPDRLYNMLPANDPSATTTQEGVMWQNTKTSRGKRRRFQKAVTTQVTRSFEPNAIKPSLSTANDTTRDLYQQQHTELYLLHVMQLLHTLDFTEFSDQDTKDNSYRGHSPRDKLVAADCHHRPVGDDDAWQDNEDGPQIRNSNPSPPTFMRLPSIPYD
jgi:hypothetical protein